MLASKFSWTLRDGLEGARAQSIYTHYHRLVVISSCATLCIGDLGGFDIVSLYYCQKYTPYSDA